MKKLVLLTLILLGGYLGVQAQFSFVLNGNPVNTTGWNMATHSYVNANTVVLTNSVADSAGYIYYNTPITMTQCGEFIANFEFQIKAHGPQGAGDGMAFWFLSAAPVAANTANMGVPNNATGSIFFIDTHDDDAGGDNPLYSLRKFTGGNYSEGPAGVNAQRIGLDAVNQNAATDTNWHTCSVRYNNGVYSVYVDNFLKITGNSVMDHLTSGYFGFSAATTATHFSQHNIRNVEIYGADIAMPVVPPASIGYVFCEDTSNGGTLTDTPVVVGTNLKWWSTPTGGTQLPGAPVISLATLGCQTFYVSQTLAPITPGPGQACGESARDTVVICVNPTPNAPVITYNPSYCAGSTFIPFPIYSQTGIFWYDVPVGGVSDTTGPVPNMNVPDTILYYAARIVNGCESKRAVVPIYILPAPLPAFTSSIKFGCAADTVAFVNTTTMGDSCVWKFGDGTILTANGPTDPNWNPTHYYTTQNQFDVWLVCYNTSTGCMDSVTNKVNNLHPLVSKILVNRDTVCQGLQVDFRDSSIYNYFQNHSFFWDFGDGDTTYTQDPAHIYKNVGVYKVMHVVTDFVPCSDTSYVYITVDSIGKMNFSFDDEDICQGQRVTFTGDYTTSGLKKLTWDFGDGYTVDNINPVSHVYDLSGAFDVKLSGKYRACPNIDSIYTINVRPYLPVNLGPDTTMCPNGPGIVIGDNINQNNPDAKWLWSTGDSSALITVRHPGIYTVRVTAHDCSSSDSVEIFKDCYIDIPNSFTPNNDGVNDYFLPRQLLSKSVAKFSMKIFDRWGEQVFKTESINGRGWDGKFNGKNQPVGVYVYMIDVTFSNGSKEYYQGNTTLLR